MQSLQGPHAFAVMLHSRRCSVTAAKAWHAAHSLNDRHVFSLKGWNKTAQGNALGKENKAPWEP